MLDFLKKVGLFSDLSEEDLIHLAEGVRELELAKGEELFAEGTPGHEAYVIKSGDVEVVKRSGDNELLIAVRGPGEVIDEIALIEDTPRSASIRARTDSVICAINKEGIDHLISSSATAARSMYYTVLERLKGTETMLRQSERMAQLGLLTAGVAHELSNPAAAVGSGAGDLSGAIQSLIEAQAELGGIECSDAQEQQIRELKSRVELRASDAQELDALASSDLEFTLEGWLKDHGLQDAWEFAPVIVKLQFDVKELDHLVNDFGADNVPAIVRWLTTSYTVHNLLYEIEQGVTRVSEILKALRFYSYPEQAQIQEVNIHEGIDSTLLILRSRLKTGISVHREYAGDLPQIEGYGGELNQVWTNIINNAADALDDRGDITIRTKRQDDWIVVEIEDNGPGIPLEIQDKIFDSFFTTKPPGKGTGLGLNISNNIVVQKHGGEIKITSQPGATIFSVWLPVKIAA